MNKLIVISVSALILSGCFDNNSSPAPEVNITPSASDAQFVTQTEQAITDTLSGADGDGDAIVFAVDSEPTNGEVVIADSGSFTYTPNAEFTGNDRFTFTVTDSNGARVIATVDLTVEAIEVLLSNLSRDAFTQLKTDQPLVLNGRSVIDDVVDPTAFDDLLMD